MNKKRCFIPGCRYGCRDESECHFYLPGQKRLRQWQDAIPKEGLKPCSRICVNHFVESDVIKGKEILGKFYPFQVWRLINGAVPKLKLGELNPIEEDCCEVNNENAVTLPRLRKETDKLPALIKNNQVGAQHVLKNQSLQQATSFNHIKNLSDKTSQRSVKDREELTQQVNVSEGAVEQLASLSCISHNTTKNNDNPNLPPDASSINENSSFESLQITTNPFTELSGRSPIKQGKNILLHEKEKDTSFPNHTTIVEIEENPSVAPTTEDVMPVASKETRNHKGNDVYLRGEFLNVRNFFKLTEKLKSEVTLPTGDWFWQMDKTNNILVCLTMNFTASGLHVKSVQISSDGKVRASYDGSLILGLFPREFVNSLEISDVLNTLHSSNACRGFPTPQSLISSAQVTSKLRNIRSPYCDILTRTGSRCLSCKFNQKHIKKTEKRMKVCETQYNVMRRDLSVTKKYAQALKRRHSAVMAQFKKLKKEQKSRSKTANVSSKLALPVCTS